MRFDLSQQRERMVERQLARRGIRNPAVTRAMRRVPRDRFVPKELAEFAYDDTPLPIDADQTISQPYIVALMADALEIEPDDKVLEIGTGSGYSAAVLGEIAAEVFTIERIESLCRSARALLAELGFENIRVRCGDGTKGWPEWCRRPGCLRSSGWRRRERCFSSISSRGSGRRAGSMG